MNNVDYIPFDKVLDDVTGGNPKILQSEYESSGEIPIVDQGSKLIGGFTNDKSKKYKGNLPVIVFGDHTKNIKYVDFDFALGADGTKILKVNKEFDSRFIFYYLGSLKLPDKVGYSRHYKYLKEKDIPLFSKDYQEKSRLFLDKANSIRQKRRETLRLADEFLRSTFLEMFGDPVTNPKEWRQINLEEIISEISYGTNEKCYSTPDDYSLPILRIPNIIKDKINLEDIKYANLSDKEREKLTLEFGDILFVRTNGNPEYIARSALFDLDGDYSFASYLIRVRLKKTENINNTFIHKFLSFPSYRKNVAKSVRTTAGNYNISSSSIKDFKLFIPPIELQNKFAEIVKKTEKLKQRYEQSLQESENLFNSLMQRAFRGEL